MSISKLGFIDFKAPYVGKIEHFPIVKGVPEMSFPISRVYPLKQREVVKICKVLDMYDVITDAWIFGSSLNMTCHPESDTDIMIKLDETNPKARVIADTSRFYFMDCCANEYDLLIYNELKPEEIEQFIGGGKGLKIK